MSMKLFKHGVTAIVAFALGMALAHAPSWAQQAASRFPKGIQGLAENQEGPPSANWLLDAKTDEERFRRLQIYAGGTDQQMWQIGYRFEQVHYAIATENWELGLHHWGKLRNVLDVALMKRPNRTPNAEALFLDTAWARLDEALKMEDAARAREVFLQERDICMSCHIAEDYEFVNGSSVFERTASFPSGEATGLGSEPD
jgi:hypothetical protein